LTYTVTLANGAPLPGTLAFGGLVPDPAGGFAGVLTGTPPANFHGAINIMVKATDTTGPGPRLSVTDTFVINVLPAAGDNTPPGSLGAVATPVHDAAMFNRSDLEFIMNQIHMAEQGQAPDSPHLAFGLREVAGTNNNTVPGNGAFGSSDVPFSRETTPVFQSADGGTSYAQSNGLVRDADPRIISNLITDQSQANAAAVEARNAALGALGDGYLPSGFLGGTNTNTPSATAADGSLYIPNVTPDAGLSAPFNTWFTLFGQFFDHGLDLVTKGGSGIVFIPLKADDPLITLGPDGVAGTGDEVTDSSKQFMVLTRATNQAGADGLLGTADDILTSGTNTITPFVDQSQTYSSHPSHQVFLREYIDTNPGPGLSLHTTGKMLNHTNPDGSLHMATWADLKANARTLGILLTDQDVNNVPLLATDAFGNFIAGANGFAQVVVLKVDGTTKLVEGTAAGLNIHNTALLGGQAVGTGIAFINDKAHFADPFAQDGTTLLTADADTTAGNVPAAGFYDNELLNAHYVAGDGRVNENIGLTAVHDLFHSEHNRLVDQTKALVQAELNNGDQSFAANWVLSGVNLTTINGADASGRPIHIWCSKNSRARSPRPSTCSATTTSIWTRRSWPSLPMWCIALATRCWTTPSTVWTSMATPSTAAVTACPMRKWA
jgi:hypothetical protein